MMVPTGRQETSEHGPQERLHLVMSAWCGRRVPAAVRARVSRICRESFPLSERIDVAALFVGAELGRSLLCTIHRGESVMGFCYSTPLGETGVEWLGYMAVDAAWRNQGIGSRLLTFLAEQLAAIPGHRGILIEVEETLNCPERVRAQRERRIRFYERHGARLVEDVRDDRVLCLAASQRETAMKLLWLPRKTGQDEALRGTLLRECMLEMLADSHGPDVQHPLVQRAAASIDSSTSTANERSV